MAGGKSRKFGRVSKALINRIVAQKKRQKKYEELNANELIPVTLETPPIPTDWDYNQSVKKIRTFVYKWKNLTIEIANELWIAREILSSQGARTDLTSGVSARSWSQYCKEIGTSRRRVNEWLCRWFGCKEHMPIEDGENPEPDTTETARHKLSLLINASLKELNYDELMCLKNRWHGYWWHKICKTLDKVLKREARQIVQQRLNRKY